MLKFWHKSSSHTLSFNEASLRVILIPLQCKDTYLQRAYLKIAQTNSKKISIHRIDFSETSMGKELYNFFLEVCISSPWLWVLMFMMYWQNFITRLASIIILRWNWQFISFVVAGNSISCKILQHDILCFWKCSLVKLQIDYGILWLVVTKKIQNVASPKDHWKQRRIFIFGALGYFILGALLESLRRLI